MSPIPEEKIEALRGEVSCSRSQAFRDGLTWESSVWNPVYGTPKSLKVQSMGHCAPRDHSLQDLLDHFYSWVINHGLPYAAWLGEGLGGDHSSLGLLFKDF